MHNRKLFIIQSILTIALLIGTTISAQNKGYNIKQLTNTNSDNRYASYNKDGEIIVFESNRDGHWQIYIMDVNGNRQERIIISDANDRHPAWHPFKNIILFESDRTGINELYTYNLADRTLTKVPIKLKGNKMYAHFAPNGKELVFNHKLRENNYNIYIISVNGKRLENIISNGFENTYPRYSPKGDAILYFSKKHTKNKNDELYVKNIITKKEKRLTISSLNNNFAVWSNNGVRIAYSSATTSGNPELFFMNHNGFSIRQITFNSEGITLPNWSPNDDNVLITSKKQGYDQICMIPLNDKL
jgi:TolB protein